MGGEGRGLVAEVTRLCFRSILASALMHAACGPAILSEVEVLQVLRGSAWPIESGCVISMHDGGSGRRQPLQLRCPEVGVKLEGSKSMSGCRGRGGQAREAGEHRTLSKKSSTGRYSTKPPWGPPSPSGGSVR